MSKKERKISNSHEIKSENESLKHKTKTTSTSKLCLAWKNINFKIKSRKSETEILKNISGQAHSSEILAILGSSGCGKSSLLSIISERLTQNSNFQVSGKIFLNSVEIKDIKYSSFVSYLPQNNYFYDAFTVREALYFIARLQQSLSSKKIDKKIRKISKLLLIQDLLDRFIGNSIKRGLSGGEVKRVCIAMELIRDSKILILDEPTSGLDSVTALIVTDALRKLAKTGKIIIVSVHQPGNRLYEMFDRILLMNSGNVIYQGKREDCLCYFEKIGFKCARGINHAEFFVKAMKNLPTSLTSSNNSQQEILSNSQIDSEIPPPESLISPIEMQEDRYSPSFSKQLHLLLKRATLGFIRSPIGLLFQLIKFVVFCIICISVYYDLGTDSRGVNNRTGLLINAIYNALYFPMIIQAFVIPIERRILHKEINENMYSVEAYFVSKCFVDFITNIFFATLLNCICYYPVGLNSESSDKFPITVGLLVLCQINGVAQGYIAGELSNDVQMASFVGPILSTPPVLFSGFFSDVSSIPDAFEWLKYTTPYFYSYQSLLQNEFDGLNIEEDVWPLPKDRFNLTGEIKYYIAMFIINTIISLLIAYSIMKLRAIKNKIKIKTK